MAGESVIIKLPRPPAVSATAGEPPPWEIGSEIDPKTGFPKMNPINTPGIPGASAPPVLGGGIDQILTGIDKGMGGLAAEALKAAGVLPKDFDPTKAPGIVEGVVSGATAAVNDAAGAVSDYFTSWTWYVVFALAAVAVLVFGAASLFR